MVLEHQMLLVASPRRIVQDHNTEPKLHSSPPTFVSENIALCLPFTSNVLVSSDGYVFSSPLVASQFDFVGDETPLALEVATAVLAGRLETCRPTPILLQRFLSPPSR